MALILDGNGLIQGLSAGGLPNGSIDADSLASTLDLSSKTMTFGNVTASGITFPASVSASGNPNTLDDYEQGTWTPTYIASTTNPTVTYQAQNGSYVKIGEFVHFSLELETSVATGGSGSLRVGGLPFTASSQRYPGGGVTTYSEQFTTNAPDAGFIIHAETWIGLTYHSSATAQTQNDVTNLTNGTSKNYLLFTGSYRVA